MKITVKRKDIIMIDGIFLECKFSLDIEQQLNTLVSLGLLSISTQCPFTHYSNQVDTIARRHWKPQDNYIIIYLKYVSIEE